MAFFPILTIIKIEDLPQGINLKYRLRKTLNQLRAEIIKTKKNLIWRKIGDCRIRILRRGRRLIPNTV